MDRQLRPRGERYVGAALDLRGLRLALRQLRDRPDQVHVEGATKTGAGIYAVFDNTVNGPVRVDWLVVN